MKLYLVRHGDAIFVDETDHRRVLSPKGIEDVTALGILLKKLNIEVSFIFHSGYVRAEQTAEILANYVNLNGTLESHTALRPTDEIEQIAAEVSQSSENILIVSHMPFLGRLMSRLITGGTETDVVAFETATAVCLEQIDSRHWIIEWIINPAIANASK